MLQYKPGSVYNDKDGLALTNGFTYFVQMFSYDLSKLPISRGFQILIIITGAILAPYQFIFQFANDVFNKTDTLKLLLLAGSIGIPALLLLSLLIISAVEPRSTFSSFSNDNERFGIFTITAGTQMLIFIAPCCFSFLLHLTQKEAILVSFSLMILLLVGLAILLRPSKAVKNDPKTPA
jgi:hypothetical protein